MLVPLLLITAALAAEPASDSPTTQPRDAAPAEGVAADGEARPEVIREAPLPEAWPEPDASGEVVLLELPAYRMAVTSAEGDATGRTFGTLFRHIKRNDISMTAPVEMALDEKDDAEGEQDEAGPSMSPRRMKSMAFVYRRADQGEAGEQGAVDVVDVPAMRVLSVGFFGDPEADRLKAMEVKLRDALEKEERYATVEAAGPLRLMGYNSPMVRSSRRFHELQLPVREREAAQTQPAEE